MLMTKENPGLKFLPAIVCEFVRTENSGKLILIGVFPSEILVADFPLNLALTLYIPLEIAELGEVKGELRVLAPNDAQLVRAEVDIRSAQKGRAALVTPNLPLQLQAPGFYKFQIRISGGEWETVAQVDVRKAPPGAILN